MRSRGKRLGCDWGPFMYCWMKTLLLSCWNVCCWNCWFCWVCWKFLRVCLWREKRAFLLLDGVVGVSLERRWRWWWWRWRLRWRWWCGEIIIDLLSTFVRSPLFVVRFVGKISPTQKVFPISRGNASTIFSLRNSNVHLFGSLRENCFPNEHLYHRNYISTYRHHQTITSNNNASSRTSLQQVGHSKV